mgnify:CR=1 FL=1
MKARKWKMKLWALIALDGGLVYSGNVPALYETKEEAWYDGNDDCEPRQVEIEVRELPRKRGRK